MKLFTKIKTLVFIGLLLLHSNTMADNWIYPAFVSTDSLNVIQILYKQSYSESSDAILVKLPKIAENRSIVPVNILTTLDDVESISILVERNPQPLAAVFYPDKQTNVVLTRIRLEKSSNVTVLIYSQGKVYSKTHYVKVTQSSGCG